MAGNIAGAWKNPLPHAPKKNDPGFPGLQPGDSQLKKSKFEYNEIQQNELIALEAIYGADFTMSTNKQTSAWKKTSPACEVVIRSPIENSDDAVSLRFAVVFTATYPKTPPLITLSDYVNIRSATEFKIQKYIEAQIKHLGEIQSEQTTWTLVEGVREILNQTAKMIADGNDFPSLEEERERHNAEMRRLQQDEEDELEKQRLAKADAEERVNAALVETQVVHQKQMHKESKNRNPVDKSAVAEPGEQSKSTEDTLVLDRLCEAEDKTGNVITFSSVTSRTDFRRGPISRVYTVRPVLRSSLESCPLLVLKETVLRQGDKDTGEFRKSIQALETCLTGLRVPSTTKKPSISHRNVLPILDFRIDMVMGVFNGAPSPTYAVKILCPFAERGPLDELLDLAGQLEIGKVRVWTGDLLDALTFLHNNQVSHQNIHAGNILLTREPAGDVVPKLADTAYQRQLHGLYPGSRALPGIGNGRSAFWLPPEIAPTSNPQYTHKSDIWDFGIVFLQMVFGLGVVKTYQSPKALKESLTMSRPLLELLDGFFHPDVQIRSRAFELSSSEFLATDAPILARDEGSYPAGQSNLEHFSPALPNGTPQEFNRPRLSRYVEDYLEEGRLGKGAFGEVVKARKKLDGQIYAVKKITQTSKDSLSEILKEVRLLSRLCHPAVVRYYNTWLEGATEKSGMKSEDSDSEAEYHDAGSGMEIEYSVSTGGLDYISSNAPLTGYPEFEYEDGEDEELSDEDLSDDGELSPVGAELPQKGHTNSGTQASDHQRTVLYISMEYCESKSLGDLIARNLYLNKTEVWRLLRQILEGLAHIHARSIAHRDLKPPNIFIARDADGVDNVKIGDFGLATSGQFAVDRVAQPHEYSDTMTYDIGTWAYSAPEVASTEGTSYTTKVDMYSLGIIFFEMCFRPIVGMERADVVQGLRQAESIVPPDFSPTDKVPTEIVRSLLTHDPKERPSSQELLESGKLPVMMESESVRRTLAGIADPSSPYFSKMMTTLFSRPIDAAKNYAWDLSSYRPTPVDLMHRSYVKTCLVSVFRRHGALESSRTSIYPRSPHYHGSDVVELLNSNGSVLQLPYDLTMGNARMLASHKGNPPVQRTYTFGSVYRDKQDTGQPGTCEEVDFDIVTLDTMDLALKEAEVIKVLDEIIFMFPGLSPAHMWFHINHSDLLQVIFDHCQVDPAVRNTVADVLSKLNIHQNTWPKIRAELRSASIGLSNMTVDEILKFDFRELPNKAITRLKKLFEGSDLFQKASSILAHLKEVAEYAKRMGVNCKIHITPLHSLKEGFFKGGMLFACINGQGKDVFAAGGRYDKLIRDHRPRIGGTVPDRHAVGFSLAWERLARLAKTRGERAFLKKAEEEANGPYANRRCDVLVACLDQVALRSSGIELLQCLWSQDISAELAPDASSIEELVSRHREDLYGWIVVIKESSVVKVKNMAKREAPDVDMPLGQLLSWLQQELSGRDSSKAPTRPEPAAERQQGEQEVRVLTVAATKNKRPARGSVIPQAKGSATKLVQSIREGPILAIETSDQVFELIRESRLSDVESWRRAEQAATSAADRRLVREANEMLTGWRQNHEQRSGSRHGFVYNTRTGTCCHYDLGL